MVRGPPVDISPTSNVSGGVDPVEREGGGVTFSVQSSGSDVAAVGNHIMLLRRRAGPRVRCFVGCDLCVLRANFRLYGERPGE